MRLLTQTLTLATLATLAAPALAGTFKVPGDFNTVQQAIDSVGASDTIVLGSQTFAESVVIDGKMDLRIVGKGNARLEGDGKGPVLSIVDSTGIKIEKLTIVGGTHGIEIVDSPDVEIGKCRIDENSEDGIHAERADDLEVNKTTITGGQRGIAVDDSDGVRLEKNRIDGVLEDGIALSSDGETTCNDARIEKNTIDNADDGIVLVGTDNCIGKNKLSGILDDGIDVNDVATEGGGGNSSDNVVEKNQIRGAGEDGIILRGFLNIAEKNKVDDAAGAGISIRGTGGHMAKKNSVTRAGGVAIEVDAASSNNEIDGNKVVMPDVDGLRIDSDNNDVLKNKVTKAGGTAFDIEGTNNVIKGNKSSKSGIFGLSDMAGGNTYDKNKFDSVDPGGVNPGDD